MWLILQRYISKKKASYFGLGKVYKGEEKAGQLHQSREAEIAN